jgi:glucose/arabinose dehydrogenase
MTRHARLVPMLVLAALAACGEDRPPPPSPGPGTPGGQTVSGNERVGWDQQASDAAQLATFRYAFYVDGTRIEVSSATCSPTSTANGFPCSAPLPPMAPGAHTLQLATFTVTGGDIFESDRSAGLTLVVSGSTAPVSDTPTAGAAGRAEPRATRTPDRGMPRPSRGGGRLQPEVVATGLDTPIDLAFAPDGRVFVAERQGRIRIADLHRQRLETALDLHEIAPHLQEVLSLAVHPRFADTRFVYLAYVVQGLADTRVVRLARVRESGGALGEHAVLLDGIPAAARGATAVIRFGPDERLYASFDDGGDPERAAHPASLNAKILRLNDDGTTPRDNPGLSPVYARGAGAPRGLDWHPATQALWQIDRLGGMPVWTAAADAGAAIGLPDHTVPSGAAFSGAADLFVPSETGDHISRVRLDPAADATIERIPVRGLGRIGPVAIGRDGAVYFCADGGAPAAGVLGRLVTVQ